MEPRTYLIVYDMIKNPDRLGTLQQYIQDSKDFVGYWNYLPFVFIVKTYETLATVRSKLQAILPNGGFLIAQISSPNIDGMLPRAAWDWFPYSHGQLSLNDILRQAATPALPTTNALGSGLGRLLSGLSGDQGEKK